MPAENFNASELYGYGNIANAQNFYSVARAMRLRMRMAESTMADKDKFLEELIIRRLTEIGDSYFYSGLKQLELGKKAVDVLEEEEKSKELMKETVKNEIEK